MMYRTSVRSGLAATAVAVAAMMVTAVAGCGDDAEPGGPPGEIWVDAPAEGAATSEGGGEVTVAVSLSRRPAARVALAVTTDLPGEGAALVEELVFEAGEVGPRTLVVRGVDDDEVDGARDYQLTFGAARSSDPKFKGAQARAVSLRNLDDDLRQSQLRVSATFHGSGRVTSSPPGISCPGTCAAAFLTGTEVVLTAAPNVGSALGGWFHEAGQDFGDTLRVTLGRAEHQVTAGFVLDEVARLIGVDGAAAERLRAAAAGAGRVVSGGDLAGPTTIGGQVLAHGGGLDPLIVAHSAATGVLAWARSMGGSGDGQVTALLAMNGGDVIAGGWFTGQLDLFGDVVTATGTGSFVVRLDSAGAVVWARHLEDGPDGGVADVIDTADGFLVCGAGAAPLGWLDGAGGFLASTAPAGFSRCTAIDRRLGGFYAAGLGTGPAQVALATVALDRSATVRVVADTGGEVLVDDLLTLAGGEPVIAFTVATATGGDSFLVRLSGAGLPAPRLVGSTFHFAHALSIVEDGAAVLAIRRTDQTELEVERRDPVTFDRLSCFELDHPVVTDFRLAKDGARRFLVGDSAARTPFPGRPLALAGASGGFVAELKLPAAGQCD